MDSITKSVIDKLAFRAEVGLKKYGRTVDRDDLTEIEWLTHAQEEAMDLTIYLEKLIRIAQLAQRTVPPARNAPGDTLLQKVWAHMHGKNMDGTRRLADDNDGCARNWQALSDAIGNHLETPAAPRADWGDPCQCAQCLEHRRACP